MTQIFDKKCPGCNMYMDNELIDPKKQFCNKCFLSIDEMPNNFFLDINVHISIKNTSPKDVYNYIDAFFSNTIDVYSHDITITLKERGKGK